VLHGVNLNMFGKRDSAVYRTSRSKENHERLHALAKELGVELLRPSNDFEAEFCEKIHTAHLEKWMPVVVNARRWTHYQRPRSGGCARRS